MIQLDIKNLQGCNKITISNQNFIFIMFEYVLASKLNGQPSIKEGNSIKSQSEQIIAVEQAPRCLNSILIQFRTQNNPSHINSVCIPRNQSNWSGTETPIDTIDYQATVNNVAEGEKVCAFLQRRRNPNPSGRIAGMVVQPDFVNGAAVYYTSPNSGTFRVGSKTFTGNQAPQYPGNPSIYIGTGKQCN